MARDIEGFCPEAGEILRAAGDFSALTFFTTAQVKLRRWHGERTLVMGDAAHALDPHLGLGATRRCSTPSACSAACTNPPTT